MTLNEIAVILQTDVATKATFMDHRQQGSTILFKKLAKLEYKVQQLVEKEPNIHALIICVRFIDILCFLNYW